MSHIWTTSMILYCAFLSFLHLEGPRPLFTFTVWEKKQLRYCNNLLIWYSTKENKNIIHLSNDMCMRNWWEYVHFWVKSLAVWCLAVGLDSLNCVNIASLNLEKVTHALPSSGICTWLAFQLLCHPNAGREMNLVLEGMMVQFKL